MTADGRLASSFRDPSGFLFVRSGRLYRQINTVYRSDYDLMIGSGLYEALTSDGLLIPHVEAAIEPADPALCYKVIEPAPVPFISYPYEWCFSQLKDAALVTLEIQKRSLERGMSLKDGSAYNIQFLGGRPMFVDTLSFEKYREGSPWVAYRQFCQHFLAPLALMVFRDIRLSQLFRVYVDGIPLDLASRLLPRRTRFAFSLMTHIHLHALSQKRYADKPDRHGQCGMSRLSFMGLVDSLQTAVKKLKWKTGSTEWGDYYERTDYSAEAFELKRQLVGRYLDVLKPQSVWDLGANRGVFSRIASGKGMPTIAFDIDPVAVENGYRECRAAGEANLLPLLLDLTNPSPGIGWQNQERMSFLDRGPADTVLALALIHHLAISNNLPFDRLASFFSGCCESLIIEFIPKSDPQVQRLLATREDIFPEYTQQCFEREFGVLFMTDQAVKIGGSERILYLMRRKADRT